MTGKRLLSWFIAAALLPILYLTAWAALIDETTRAYGFNRRGANITSAMNQAYELLLAESRVRDVDGKVVTNE